MKGNKCAVLGLLGITGCVGSIAVYRVILIIVAAVCSGQIQYVFDEHLSTKAKEHIAAYANCVLLSSAQDYINAIQQQFKYIDTVQLSYMPEMTQLYIKAREPIARINDHYVADRCGHLFKATVFQDTLVQKLKSVFIAQLSDNLTLPDNIHQWVSQISPALCATYNITWIDEHTIELKKHDDPALIIRCSSEQSMTDMPLQMCMQAKESLLQAVTLKATQAIVTDIRFDRQIIVSKR